jgi:hypothetical protein
MDEKNLRSRNRRVGLMVLAGMFALAGITAIYAWLTVPYRRQVDLVQPDARPFRADLLSVAVIATGVVAIGLIVYRQRMSNKK